MQRVGRDVAVRSAFAGELNLKDAVSAVAFKELSALQHLLCQRCGPPFLVRCVRDSRGADKEDLRRLRVWSEAARAL
jgi:hypothetical protein